MILKGKDKAADFLWRVLSSSCLYAASLVPEISDDVVSVDQAMEWGYAWGQGPFRLLDTLGVAAVAERARAEGRSIPPLVQALLDAPMFEARWRWNATIALAVHPIVTFFLGQARAALE